MENVTMVLTVSHTWLANDEVKLALLGKDPPGIYGFNNEATALDSGVFKTLRAVKH
jgi:hypothetical protein